MAKDTSRGRNGTGGRDRSAASMEDTDPMTKEDILEAFGHSGPDRSTSGMHRGPDPTPPEPDAAHDQRPQS